MNKSKRILSAILASTVALSSYAAYAAPDGENGGDTGATTPAAGTSHNITDANIPSDFNNTITNEAAEEFNTYLSKDVAEPDVTFDNDEKTVTVKFGKIKGAYVNDGKVNSKDPVYLIIDTDITGTAAENDTDAEGFRFAEDSPYSWDEDDHHDFNFADGKIKLWLPAVLPNNTLEVKYKTGKEAETETITINYEYANEIKGLKAYIGYGENGTKAEPETMVDSEYLDNYKFNQKLYSGELVEDEENENTYNLNITAPYGAMKGGATAGEGGKNVLVVLEMDAPADPEKGFTFKKGENVIDDEGGWLTHGSKFIEGDSDENATKTYVTLWISLTDARVSGEEEIAYTITDNGGNVTTINVNITDETEYTLTKDAELDETDYDVTVTSGTDGKATVTVAPKEDSTKTISSAKLLDGEGNEIDLSDGEGGFTKEVTIKELLTPEQIAAGIVDVKLTNDNLTVETLAQSDIKVTNITLAKENPETVTGDDAVAKYTQNRSAVVSVGTYDATKNEITVKVASDLLMGDNTGATNGANICLVMELETAAILNDDSYGFDKTQIENIDVADGYKFVDTVDAANAGKYVVLWINAHKDAMVDGEKTVVYKDEGGNVITTVKLVEVPVVKETPATQTTAITTVTEAAVIAQAKTNLGITDDDNLLDFSVDTLPETGKNVEVDVTVTVKDGAECVLVNKDGEVVTELTTKVKVSVAAEVKVENLTVSQGVNNPETMSGTELTRYQDNKALYSFGTLGTDADGNSTLHIDAQFGKMVGSGETATGGKNVLVVLAFDKLEGGYTIVRTKDGNDVDDTDITNAGSGTWKADGSKFVETADSAKSYFTLWISLTDDRIENGMEFTITPTVVSGDTAVDKKLIIDFTDTTEYTLNPPAVADANYTVTVAAGSTNRTKKVTVTPADGKTITAAAVSGTDLTPVGDGSYSGVVDVKDLLTSDQIAAGTTEATLVAGTNLTVTVAARSTTVVATDMTVGIENPPTMTDDETQLNRYKANRKLYVDSLVWNATSKTATVKVPAELMTGSGATGTAAANVCLILKLESELPASEGKYSFKSLNGEQWTAPSEHVTDGWQFVENPNEDDQGKYVVLWIGAGSEASWTNNTKTVIYTDKDGAVVATVNLVKVPGVKEVPVDQDTAIALTTDEAIIAQAKTNLGIASNANLDELDFTVGAKPTAVGEGTVTVTVKAKTGSECVLVDKDGNVVNELTTTVKVAIAEGTTGTVTFGTPTNGSFTAKVGDTAIETGAAVEVGATITLTPSPATGYKFSAWNVTDANGATVTVTDNAFTMPAGGVTINATFTANSSGGGSTSGGGSWSGGGSSSSSGSSTSTSTTLNVTNKTIPTTANAVKDTERVNANTTNSTGVAISVDKSDSKVAYAKIEAPSSTNEAALWAEAIIKKASTDKVADVKKAAEEAVNAVANNKGFALNVDILDTNRKTVVPGKNVEITVPVPAAYKGKTLYAYRVTERGVVPVLATTANDKITFNAGSAGEYIFTTEKLANALTQKKGDVDNGGKANTADATLVLKHIADLSALKDEKLYFADVNGDGVVNVKDATEILKIVAGIVK